MTNINNINCPKCGAAIPEDAPSGLCPKCALEGVASTSISPTGGRNTPPPSVGEIASHFPELEILELVGAGGMGAVYKARQPQLDRLVALKILSDDLASDPAFVERFDREAKVLARLSHPNIVGVHNFGTAGPYCYLLMEYVDGVNLRQAMRTGGFSPTEALALVEDVCSALKFAHEEGILHRDIKPENILIDSKGRVKIADFGIAKLVGGDRQHDVTLTMQGSILGSPHYMAPEQIETPGDVDQRADIYSLGVVLYEMLTGELPIGRFALPSEKVSMDARIDHIVLRTLEKERSARYQTAGDVGTEVGEVTKHPAPAPAKATPAAEETGAARYSLTSAFLTGIGVILGILFLAFWVMTISPSQPYESSEEMASSISAGLFLAVVNLLAAAGTSLVGLILGAVALVEIRRSGGTKTGLGSAVFATAAWPIVLIFFFALAFLSANEDAIKWAWVVPISLLITLLGGYLLIRSLYRLSGGVVQRDGTRDFPSFGRAILPLVIFLFGGPLLIVVGANFLPSGQRSGPPAGSPAESVEWLYGSPELSMSVKIGPEASTAFRLVWTDAEGNVTREPIGVLSGRDSAWGKGKALESVVRIGMARGEAEGDMGFIATLDATGESAGIFRATDLEGWNLDLNHMYRQNVLTFFRPSSTHFRLGTLKDAEGEVREMLTLEVLTTSR